MRHLSAVSKYDVNMLLDVRPRISIVSQAAGTMGTSGAASAAGQLLSFASFQDRYPVDLCDNRVPHFVEGETHPWETPQIQDNAAYAAALESLERPAPATGMIGTAGRQSLALVRAAVANGATGAGSTSEVRPSELQTWLQQIQDGAHSGNKHLVNSRLAKIQTALEVREAREARVSMKSGKAIGGTSYRPDFMLHAVLASEHLRLGQT